MRGGESVLPLVALWAAAVSTHVNVALAHRSHPTFNPTPVSLQQEEYRVLCHSRLHSSSTLFLSCREEDASVFQGRSDAEQGQRSAHASLRFQLRVQAEAGGKH